MASLVNKNPPMIYSIFSPKNFLISITSALVALMLKIYAPLILELLLSVVPMIWTTLGSWFRPPYLYVIVNFIIIAIAASSRFQHQNNNTTTNHDDDDDDVNKVREVVAPIKAQPHLDQYPYSFDVVTKNNSGEHKEELEVKAIQKPIALEVKGRKNLEAENIHEMKSVSCKPRLVVGVVSKDKDEVKTKKKPPAVMSRPTESAYTETKKKVMESLQEFEVRRHNKNKKDVDMEDRWLQVRNKIETSAKEGEDHHARSKSLGMSFQINSTHNNPSPYFFSQEKGLASDYQENHQHTLQAGKDESSTEVEEEGEENDTLEGTWKMIMERSRNQNSGPQEASLGVEKFEESNPPSQSTKMQDTSNW